MVYSNLRQGTRNVDKGSKRAHLKFELEVKRLKCFIPLKEIKTSPKHKAQLLNLNPGYMSIDTHSIHFLYRCYY